MWEPNQRSSTRTQTPLAVKELFTLPCFNINPSAKQSTENQQYSRGPDPNGLYIDQNQQPSFMSNKKNTCTDPRSTLQRSSIRSTVTTRRRTLEVIKPRFRLGRFDRSLLTTVTGVCACRDNVTKAAGVTNQDFPAWLLLVCVFPVCPTYARGLRQKRKTLAHVLMERENEINHIKKTKQKSKKEEEKSCLKKRLTLPTRASEASETQAKLENKR